MAETHAYQGSTIRPGCCIVLVLPGTEELWDGQMSGESEVVKRCGRGPLDEVHQVKGVWTSEHPQGWEEWFDAGH